MYGDLRRGEKETRGGQDRRAVLRHAAGQRRRRARAPRHAHAPSAHEKGGGVALRGDGAGRGGDRHRHETEEAAGDEGGGGGEGGEKQSPGGRRGREGGCRAGARRGDGGERGDGFGEDRLQQARRPVRVQAHHLRPHDPPRKFHRETRKRTLPPPVLAPQHLLLAQGHGSTAGRGREERRQRLLPLHRTRAVVVRHAHGTPGSLPHDAVAAAGVRRPPGHPDDGRREVSVQGRVHGRKRGQPRPLSRAGAGERQGHSGVRVRQTKNLSVLGSGLRRTNVSHGGENLEERHRQHGQRHLRVSGICQYWEDGVSGHTGGAQFSGRLSHRARGQGRETEETYGLSHPLRHRSGSLF
mmetsp:Transcript_33411/g.66063  ORF Transcript_33411/g.66063 Transcript_33411/m.66063 type:complete len:354 (-) Transcript_33411:597-1658(-)